MTQYTPDIMHINTDYEVYHNLIRLDEWKVVYQDDVSAVFIPTSKNRNHWIIPDEKFHIDYEKFKARILN